MSEPFLAEIKIMSFNFPPRGYAFCNGQLLPINQNQALFSLVGTTYGGDGRVNFALPNLQGRVPVHMGPGYDLGQKAGESAHTLTVNEMPQHVHSVAASSSSGVQNGPANNYLGAANNVYHAYAQQNVTSLNPGTITNTGESQAHTNMQPYLVLNFCIALQGIFPSRN